MYSQLKLAGSLALIAALGACATPAPTHYGSQPVNGGYASNNGYQAPPVNNGGNNSNGNYNNNNGYGNGQNGGVVTRVDSLGTKRDTGLGAVIGAGVGAIAGNQIGRTMNDAKTTGTVAGAVGGGLLGNAIERNQNKNNTMLRVTVRLDDGSERYWDVTESQIDPQVGQRVRIENDQLFAN